MNQNPTGSNPINMNPNATQNPYGQNAAPQNNSGPYYPPQPSYQSLPQQNLPQQNIPPYSGLPGQGNYPGNAGKKGTNSRQTKKGKAKKKSNVGWVFLGIFLMLALAVAGAYFGYQAAVSARVSEYNRKAKQAASEQYQMALSDIAAGKMENAKTRLDYVLSVDPNFPGATETYQEVVIALYPKATPTPAMTSTPMPTPTVDLRGEEEMYQGIVSTMYSQDWQSALDQMDALRDKNLAYKGLDVDGMYYIALRNIGVQLINQGYLESGVYKITLSGSFGPIDANADALRTAARSYLAGAGFWEIDWNKALEYYANAYQSYPNMFDRATGLTAQERYVDASFEVANLYVISEQYCDAIPYYDQGFLLSVDEVISATATAVFYGCYGEPTAVPVAENEGIPNIDNNAPEPVVENPEATTAPATEGTIAGADTVE